MHKTISSRKIFHIFTCVLLSLAVFYVTPNSDYPKAPVVAAMIVLMAYLWITELIPLAVTSLIPMVFLPVTGAGKLQEITPFYSKPIIFLFLGGFLLAIAIQKTGLHKRIALYLLHKIGDKPHQLVLGFMISTALLSMWISNTASVMVMMPVGLSVLETAKNNGVQGKTLLNFGLGIMLGLAYAADIGGMVTPIGTPPNLVFLEMYNQLFPDLPQIGFVNWMAMVFPMSILFLFLGWLILTKLVFKLPNKRILGGHAIIKKQYKELGKITPDEKKAGIIFLLAIVLWLTGSTITVGENFTFTGWRAWLNVPEFKDASVAIFAAILLFVVPSSTQENQSVLSWKDAKNVPWGILLLFGGGLALAGGFQQSGLADIVGNLFSRIQIESPAVAVFSISFIVTFLTEFTSNTAITTLLLPIIAEASIALKMDPRLLMIPATLSASCAFMMPVASPTQAIVFGSGYVSIKNMIKGGLLFNLLGVIIVSVIFLLLGTVILGI